MSTRRKAKMPKLRPEVLYRHPLEHHMARVYDRPYPWGRKVEACVPCAIIPCPTLKAARQLVSFAKTADGRAFLLGGPH